MKKPERSDRLLPWPEVAKRVPYTRQWAGRLEKVGRFPKRVQVGPNRVAWLESEVDQLIAGLAAERDRAA